MEKSFLNDEPVLFLCNYIAYKEYTKEIESIKGINYNFSMIHLNFIVQI